MSWISLSLLILLLLLLVVVVLLLLFIIVNIMRGRKCKIVTCMLMAIASEGLHRGCQGLSRHQLIQREIPIHHIFPACKAYACCIMTPVTETLTT